MQAETTTTHQTPLFWLDKIAELLDNRFRIPFTNIRFGIDFIIGLVPYVGDLASFIISAFLVLIMGRYGGSGMLAVKMVGNILLDAAVGVIPLLGDIFDLRYKANMRNVRLLRQHYTEGKHKGSALWVVLVLLLALGLAFFLMIFLVWKVLSWLLALAT